MNYPIFKQPEKNKVLFVWDGTERFIQTADQYLSAFENVSVRAVHLMPHESIHTYATVGHANREPTLIEKTISRSFRKSVRPTKTLMNVKLEILFGERITEILRFASRVKAKYILVPQFQQSCFSLWIHGDLNQRLVDKSNCRVVFLDVLNAGSIASQ